VNSTRPHHVGGSGAATRPEETIYSKVATVGPDPHEKVSDPWMHILDLRARFKTSTGTNQTPEMGPKPLRGGGGVRATQSRVRCIQSKEYCHTRISGVQSPGANIITRCAGTKSHTYDESWHRIECHIFTI
jgi:hypothetical protein